MVFQNSESVLGFDKIPRLLCCELSGYLALLAIVCM